GAEVEALEDAPGPGDGGAAVLEGVEDEGGEEEPLGMGDGAGAEAVEGGDPGPLEGVGGVELEGIGEAALEGGTQLWQGAVEHAGESQEPPRAGVALAE